MKLHMYLILAALGLFLAVGCQERKETFIIPNGHVGMFGYGSLTSKKFIETGLLDSHYNGPFLLARLKGYKRSWTFAWPTDIPTPYHDGNYYRDYLILEGDSIYPKYLHYLNIRENENETVNGVLYIVPEADLPTYDLWELGYERFDVSGDITDYAIEGGPVFAYKALPEFEREPTPEYRINIIEQSYVDILRDAFAYWGTEFELEFKNSTEPIDSIIIKANLKATWTNPPLERTEELKAKFKYPSR